MELVPCYQQGGAQPKRDGEGTPAEEAGRWSTLVSIPARARAVYAPLENPKMQILSPDWSEMEELTCVTT